MHYECADSTATDRQTYSLPNSPNVLTHRQAGYLTSLSPADALAPPPADVEAEESPELLDESPELLDDPPDELEDELEDPLKELEAELPDESDDDESLDDSVERMLEASSKLGGPLKENWTPVGSVPVCPFLSITPKAVSCKTHRERCKQVSALIVVVVLLLGRCCRSMMQRDAASMQSTLDHAALC